MIVGSIPVFWQLRTTEVANDDQRQESKT
jgi:hypothetical protein